MMATGDMYIGSEVRTRVCKISQLKSVQITVCKRVCDIAIQVIDALAHARLYKYGTCV